MSEIILKGNSYLEFLIVILLREDFSDEELLKRYRFGRESLPFIARLIEDEVRRLTRRNQAHHLNDL